MELDSLKDRWQRRGGPEPHWQKGEDMNELRARLAGLRETARRRDLRETAAAVFVAALFTWVAFSSDRSLARVGAAIIVAGALFIIIWMPLAGGRNREPERDLPVVEFFRRELRYLDRQIHLLRSVFWWYIAPNLAGLLLFFMGTGRSATVTGALIAMAFALAGAVYWLNRLAARAGLAPLREEVARLLRDLENGASPT
jgi:hypothetical protein